MSKDKNESNSCCSTSNCCGFEKSSVAKFLRHIAEFFDTKEK
jgi:hypothetical protein